MQYLPLFLLFAAALIAGWFYLQRAKARSAKDVTSSAAAPSAQVEPDDSRVDRPA